MKRVFLVLLILFFSCKKLKKVNPTNDKYERVWIEEKIKDDIKIQAEFYFSVKDTIKNQFKIFNDNSLDTLKSQFYVIKFDNKQKEHISGNLNFYSKYDSISNKKIVEKTYFLMYLNSTDSEVSVKIDSFQDSRNIRFTFVPSERLNNLKGVLQENLILKSDSGNLKIVENYIFIDNRNKTNNPFVKGANSIK